MSDVISEIRVLSAKMDRYEKHREELRKDVKTVSDRQNEIVTLLAGSDMNSKKGVLSLVDEIDKRVTLMKEQNISLQKDIDNTKTWGRLASGVFLAVFVVIINAIKDKL